MRRYVLLTVLAVLSLWPVAKIHDQVQSGKHPASPPAEVTWLAELSGRVERIPIPPPIALESRPEATETLQGRVVSDPVRSVDERSGAQHRLDQDREAFLKEVVQKNPTDPAAHLALARHLTGTYDYGGAREAAGNSVKVAVAKNDSKALEQARAVIKVLNEVDQATDPLAKRIISYDANVSNEPLPMLESSFPPQTEAQKRETEAWELQLKTRLHAEYLLPGSSWVQSVPDANVQQRIFLADDYRRIGNSAEAERRYSDLLHEHADSPFVHLNYAYHLAEVKGVSRALGYLRERQEGFPHDLVLKVAADTARDLSQVNLSETDWAVLTLEISHRLHLLGFNEYVGAWK